MEAKPSRDSRIPSPVSISASVLFIKPVENIPHLLLFERSSNTKFGGVYAFPGGKVESQDFDFLPAAELRAKEFNCKWAKSVVDLFNFNDISLRITWLREVYEEISILPWYKGGVYTVLHKTDIDGTCSTQDFFKFCMDKEVIPAIDRLKAWKRIAPPYHINNRSDTQFYLYFIENGEEENIEINEQEHSNMVIDSIDNILAKYISDDIFMLLPQAVIIGWAKHFGDYASLVQAADRCDKSVMSYLEMRSEIIPVPDNSLDDKNKIISDMKFKQMMNLYDEYNTKQRDKEWQLISFDLNNIL